VTRHDARIFEQLCDVNDALNTCAQSLEDESAVRDVLSALVDRLDAIIDLLATEIVRSRRLTSRESAQTAPECPRMRFVLPGDREEPMRGQRSVHTILVALKG